MLVLVLVVRGACRAPVGTPAARVRAALERTRFTEALGALEAARDEARRALEQAQAGEQVEGDSAAGGEALEPRTRAPAAPSDAEVARGIETSLGGQALDDLLARASAKWSLTPRQQEIVGRAVRGMSNKEIAGSLRCAVVTVENHLTAIYRKAEVDSRSRLIARLMEL